MIQACSCRSNSDFEAPGRAGDGHTSFDEKMFSKQDCKVEFGIRDGEMTLHWFDEIEISKEKVDGSKFLFRGEWDANTFPSKKHLI